MNNKVLASGIFALLFIQLILLVKLVDVAAVGAAGTSIGLSHLNNAFHSFTGVNMSIYELTDLLGKFALLVAAAVAVFGLIQLIKRRSLLKVDREILTTGGLYVVVLALYALFKVVIVNYRPIIMPGESMPEASFPSSHTMLIFVIMGSVCILLGRYLKKKGLKTLLRILCWVIVAVTVIGRLICGVHWLTDIIGGVLISLALLFLYSGVLNKR